MTTHTAPKPSKGMHIALWIVQGLLAVIYLMAGGNKTFQSVEELAKMLPWVLDSPLAMVRFIGISELVGAMGLILPSLLRVQPRLTVYAAGALAVLQILAAGFHIMQGEAHMIGINFVFIALSLFVVWGRSKRVPIMGK